MTPNVLARSPKTHLNRTTNWVLLGHNRALLLHQQTTVTAVVTTIEPPYGTTLLKETAGSPSHAPNRANVFDHRL
jgi:hypothetical protein